MVRRAPGANMWGLESHLSGLENQSRSLEGSRGGTEKHKNGETEKRKNIVTETHDVVP